MSTAKLTLVSHKLCPFVQRAAIALDERSVPFERRDVDLVNKPEWFTKLSPLGKVPLLLVADEHHQNVIFESSIIAQYVDEATQGRLLAGSPLERARQRAWLEFASNTIGQIGTLYNAETSEAFQVARQQLIKSWRTLEDNIDEGPWFSGERFSLVDAAFAPAFRYFDVFEKLTDVDFFPGVPRVSAWRGRLQERPSVVRAVDGYHGNLVHFLARKDTVLGRAAHASQHSLGTAVA